jgi:hypothetical protein
MATNIPVTTSVSGLQPLFYDAGNDYVSRSSMATFVDYLQGQLTAPGFTPQYAAPSVSGTVVTVTNSSESTWLIIHPLAGYAAMTITLPLLANCIDGQEVLVICAHIVTTLTINGNGSTVVGAPTALTANAFFRLRFGSLNSTWYRVG